MLTFETSLERWHGCKWGACNLLGTAAHQRLAALESTGTSCIALLSAVMSCTCLTGLAAAAGMLWNVAGYELCVLLLQNRTYERWHLARQAFGGIGGGLVNVVRQVSWMQLAHLPAASAAVTQGHCEHRQCLAA